MSCAWGDQGARAACKRPRSEDGDFEGWRSDEDVSPANPEATPDPNDSDDPLEAFMREINTKIETKVEKPLRDDIEDEDELESYVRFVKEKKETALVAVESSMIIGYDMNDNPIIDESQRPEHTLAPVDHSTITYDVFDRCFYVEDPSIAAIPEDINNLERKKLEMKVMGYETPKLVSTFKQCGFDTVTLKNISKRGFTAPTGIQRQVLPIILSGRDIIGVAKTGSGKTLAYVLPMIPHILAQPYLEKGDGPIAIILAPTRELAQQIYTETKKFCKPHQIQVSAVFGGMGKYGQYKELKSGCEVIVATPGRLIDLAKKKAFNFRRVTYLVLDEADRMFDLGFEAQVRSLVGQIRPDRQTLLFSATFRQKIEFLSMNILTDPIKVTVGEVGAANKDVQQEAVVLPNREAKFPWLLAQLPAMLERGQVLIFVGKRDEAEELAVMLLHAHFGAAAIHGDMAQDERDDMLNGFKDDTATRILVATDIAARGLDIRSVRSVVNYTKARNIEAHIHRVGRTGRAGDKGVAFTIVDSSQDSVFAGQLVHHFKQCEQVVSDELLRVAKRNPKFRGSGRGRGRGGGRGRGRGRGQYGSVPPPSRSIGNVSAALAAARAAAERITMKLQGTSTGTSTAPPTSTTYSAPPTSTTYTTGMSSVYSAPPPASTSYAPPPTTTSTMYSVQPISSYSTSTAMTMAPPLPPVVQPPLPPQRVDGTSIKNPLYAHFVSSDHTVGSTERPKAIVILPGVREERVLDGKQPI